MFKPDRLIASIEKGPHLPTVIFFCCLHGNEKAGYEALNSFFEIINKQKETINGNVFGILGNKEAFLSDHRFIDKDLNRIWTKSHIKAAQEEHRVSEYYELEAIYNQLYQILSKYKSQVYCIDLHTTSGPTNPFIIMNDALNNRAFVRNLGYPVIFNVESYIEGALLNLLNDLGHISLAFEGGEHYSKDSVTEIKKFCFKVLLQSGVLNEKDLEFSNKTILKLKPRPAKYFEMVYRQDLKPEDSFEMSGNYLNFQKLKKGERVATVNDESLYSPKNYQIFMPLYQKKGEDGFFYVQRISNFKLKIARILRNINAEKLFTILPGVNKMNFYTLSIPKSIVNYVPQRILFALGYRKSIEVDSDKIYFTKQERKLRELPKLESFKSPYKV